MCVFFVDGLLVFYLLDVLFLMLMVCLFVFDLLDVLFLC